VIAAAYFSDIPTVCYFDEEEKSSEVDSTENEPQLPVQSLHFEVFMI